MRPNLLEHLKKVKESNNNLPIVDTRASEIKIPDKLVEPYLVARDKYNEEFNPLEINPNEVLGTKQSFTDKIANGLVKGLGTTLTSASEIIAAPLDLTVGAITGDFAGGPAGEVLDDVNDYLAERFPNYYTQKEQNMNFLESLGTTNFWADKALNGVGYLAGAYLGGKGVGALFSWLGKGAKAASLGNKLGLAAEAGEIGAGGSKLAKYSDPAKQLLMSGLMAHGEAAVEARDVRDTMFQDLVAKRDSGDVAFKDKSDEELMDIAKAAGNTTYALNLPLIAGSDVALFGKALFPNLRQTRKFLDVTGNLGEAVAKQRSRLGRIGTELAEGFALEGGQELTQLGVSEGTKKFYLGQYSGEGNSLKDLISDVVSETARNLGTKEGLESIFLGGILGGPTKVLTSSYKDDLAKTQAYADFENSQVKNNLTRIFDNSAQTATASVNQDIAAQKNDKFGFKNASYDVIKGLTKQAEELGGTDTLVTRLEALKSTDVEQFKKTFGYTEDITEQERDTKINNLISTVKDIAEKHKQIIDNNPSLNPVTNPQNRPVFDAVFDAVTNFEDIDKREKEVSSEIAKLTSTVYSKMANSIVGPYMKEYVKKGIDYNTFRNSDDYKEKYGSTVQEYIDSIKEENPDKAKEVERLTKDLFSLAQRREQMIKQYNEALEQPENIIKQAQEAKAKADEERAKKAKEEQDKIDALANKIKEGKEVTSEDLQTYDNNPQAVEQKLQEIKSEEEKLQDLLNEADVVHDDIIAAQEEDDVELEKVLTDKLNALNAEIDAKGQALKEKIEKEAKERKKEPIKAVDKKVTSKESLGNNTYTGLYPYDLTSTINIQNLVNTNTSKDILSNARFIVEDRPSGGKLFPSETKSTTNKIISLEYNGEKIAGLPWYNKVVLKDGRVANLNEISEADLRDSFDIDPDTTFEDLQTQYNLLKNAWRVIEQHNGKPLSEIPVDIIVSLGELVTIPFDARRTIKELEDTNVIKFARDNDNNIIIADRKLDKPIEYPFGSLDNLLDENGFNVNINVPLLTKDSKLKSRYVGLVYNGNTYQWLALEPIGLSEEQLRNKLEPLVTLQKEIDKGPVTNLQEKLDVLNKSIIGTFYTAKETGDWYLYPKLTPKGNYQLVEVKWDEQDGNKIKEERPYKGANSIDQVVKELQDYGTIRGSITPEELHVTTLLKNGGFKIAYNQQKENIKVEPTAPISDFIVPETVTEQISLEDLLNQETTGLSNEAFSIGTETGNLDIEEAKAYIKSVIPQFDVQDIVNIAERLHNNGITFGAFKDNVIYLNESAPEGTQYHEAFHAVFRGLLTKQEQQELLKGIKVSDKEIGQFLLERPKYQNLNKEQLTDLVKEEKLADKFKDWKSKKEPKTLLGKFFAKIKEWYNLLLNTNDAIFYKIDKGYYKNRTVNYNSTPVYMAIPYRKIKVDNQDILKRLTAAEEDKLVGAITAETVDNAQLLPIRQAFEKTLEDRKARYFNAAEFDKTKTVEQKLDYLAKNVGLFNTPEIKDKVYQKVKQKVSFYLSIDESIDDIITSEEEDRDLRNFEKSNIHIGGITSLNQYVRALIGTTTYEEIDEFGLVTRVGVNVSNVFNGITRTLVNTDSKDFINKLDIYSKYNKDVAHFLAHFKELVGYENGQPTKNKHVYQAFIKDFEKFKIGFKFVKINQETGETDVTNSNFKDVDIQQTDKWAIGYANFKEKVLPEYKIDVDTENSLPRVVKQTGKIDDKQLERLSIKANNDLETIGISLSRLYLDYSIIKNREASTDYQKELKEQFKGFDGITGKDGKGVSEILNIANKRGDLYSEKGALTRLRKIALENASFDERVGSSSFQNAEGELVNDIILGSFLIRRTQELQNPEARAKTIEAFKEYYKDKEDEFLLDLHFFATENNPLLDSTFDKQFVVYVTDGLRETEGNGKSFKHMSPADKELMFLSTFTKREKKGEETFAYYYPQVLEASSTGYLVLLPVKEYTKANSITKEAIVDIYHFVENEHKRIQYLKEANLPSIEGFNTPNGRGYNFVINKWLTPDLQEELKNSKEITPEQKRKIQDNIISYINTGFQQYVNRLVEIGLVVNNNGVLETNTLPQLFRTGKEVNLNELFSFYVNDTINTQAYTNLINGDIAYKIKDYEDYVKRNKGAMASGTTLKGEYIKSKVIKDAIRYFQKSKDGLNFEDVTDKFKTFLNEKQSEGISNKEALAIWERENESSIEGGLKGTDVADAQTYADINFNLKRLNGFGKLTSPIVNIYKKIKEGKPRTRLELELLTKQDALLNPKKDIYYGPNAYIKTSIGFILPETVTYLDNGIEKVIPGREGWYKHYKELEDIDIISRNSSSKGTTVIDMVRTLDGTNYGEQVTTKGVKEAITDGTQQLALIWSELPEELKEDVNKLDELDAKRIVLSTENAINLLREKDEPSLRKLLPTWYDTLVSTGANSQLLDFFSVDNLGNPKFNLNIPAALSKFTAMYLAHWTNTAFKQKVDGFKFTLLSSEGYNILEDENGIVRTEQFRKNPRKVTSRPLKHNVKGNVLYSECVVPKYLQELYDLDVDQEIPDDLAYMLGYRIPTEGAQSKVVLKIVDFLPAEYGNAVLVPHEVILLSGADFDIDSLFVQRYSVYTKDGVTKRYGSEKTLEGQFDEFVTYVKDEVSDELKSLLDNNKEYQELLFEKKTITDELSKVFEEKELLEKSAQEEFKLLNKELSTVREFTSGKELEEVENEIYTDISIAESHLDKQIKDLLKDKAPTFERLKEVKEKLHKIETLKLKTALRNYSYPASKTAFKEKYPDGKFKAVLNNELLDLKIKILGNPEVQKEKGLSKISTDTLQDTIKQLQQEFPQSFTDVGKTLGFFSPNDKLAAIINNDAGKAGIGPAAKFNVVFQYLAKENIEVNPEFSIEIGDNTYKAFGENKKGFTYINENNIRIGKLISEFISAMTDNAKDPIASKANLNTETLGVALTMVGLGIDLKTVLKVINSPSVKEYVNFKVNRKNAVKDKYATLEIEPGNKNITIEELDSALKTGYKNPNILAFYKNVEDASTILFDLGKVLNLRKSTGTSLPDIFDIEEAINTLESNEKPKLLGIEKILSIKPVAAMIKAHKELYKDLPNFFISETPIARTSSAYLFKMTNKLDNPSEKYDTVLKDVNSYITLHALRNYIKLIEEGKIDKKYNKEAVKELSDALTPNLFIDNNLGKDLLEVQKNAKSYGVEKNRFLKYIKVVHDKIDLIQGNTRQLRDLDYQQELIDGFDDLYRNPKTKSLAVKLFAYITLKDGGRYKNNSFQSEIAPYMYKVYSDAMDWVIKNPISTDELNTIWPTYTNNRKLLKSVRKPFKSNLTVKLQDGELTINNSEKENQIFESIKNELNNSEYVTYNNVIYKFIESTDNKITYKALNRVTDFPAEGFGSGLISPYGFTLEENRELEKLKVKSEDTLDVPETYDFPTIVKEEDLPTYEKPKEVSKEKPKDLLSSKYDVNLVKTEDSFDFVTKSTNETVKQLVSLANEKGWSSQKLLNELEKTTSNDIVDNQVNCKIN